MRQAARWYGAANCDNETRRWADVVDGDLGEVVEGQAEGVGTGFVLVQAAEGDYGALVGVTDELKGAGKRVGGGAGLEVSFVQ